MAPSLSNSDVQQKRALAASRYVLSSDVERDLIGSERETKYRRWILSSFSSKGVAKIKDTSRVGYRLKVIGIDYSTKILLDRLLKIACMRY